MVVAKKEVILEAAVVTAPVSTEEENKDIEREEREENTATAEVTAAVTAEETEAEVAPERLVMMLSSSLPHTVEK